MSLLIKSDSLPDLITFGTNLVVVCYTLVSIKEENMIKHILDRPAQVSRSWLGRAVNIEKGLHPDRASLLLQRRSRKVQPLHRAKYYLRFARGLRP
jgi:hypothetical protein